MRKRYLKNIDTGYVMSMEDWKKDAIRFFTSLYKQDDYLQQNYYTLEDYLKHMENSGNFYIDLEECDKDGNILENV